MTTENATPPAEVIPEVVPAPETVVAPEPVVEPAKAPQTITEAAMSDKPFMLWPVPNANGDIGEYGKVQDVAAVIVNAVENQKSGERRDLRAESVTVPTQVTAAAALDPLQTLEFGEILNGLYIDSQFKKDSNDTML